MINDLFIIISKHTYTDLFHIFTIAIVPLLKRLLLLKCVCLRIHYYFSFSI